MVFGRYYVCCLCACLSVCLFVCDASPQKLLNGFGWHFAQRRRSLPDTVSCILVTIAAGVPPGELKVWFTYVNSSPLWQPLVYIYMFVCFFTLEFFLQGGQQCWALWAFLAACPCMLYIDITYVFVYWANKDACLLAYIYSLDGSTVVLTQWGNQLFKTFISFLLRQAGCNLHIKRRDPCLMP